MKYYIREIRPYIKFMIPGVDAGCAVDGYGWFSEDKEEELRKKITLNDPLEMLIFKERFVEVSNETISYN